MKLKSKILLSILATSSAAFAQTAPAPAAAPAAPETTIAYNVGVVSQYRYRGLAQTKGSPALQGGVDYTNANGFYLGAWASTISWIEDSGRGQYATTTTYSGNSELDLYGGYKFEKAGVNYDVGYLRYQYTGNDLDKASAAYANANTDEVYAAATSGVYTFKYSYATSTLFGYLNSKGSNYMDLSANYDLGNGVTFTPHIGRQKVRGTTSTYYPGGLTYTDYSATFAKDLGDGLSVSFAYITTNARNAKSGNFLSNSTSYNTAKGAVVAGVKYAF
jgi:uncharacterized protein (TIGR02001 family)